jgi:glycosyl transferase family 25
MSHNIDKIFYINLKKRTDRREQIETELRNYGLTNFERFEAIENTDYPPLGCTQSHLAVLRIAQQRGYNNVLVLEDDFHFTVSKEIVENQLEKLFGLKKLYQLEELYGIPEKDRKGIAKFDACMLEYGVVDQTNVPDHDFIIKIIKASNASGYIINKALYHELVHVLEYASNKLEETRQDWNYTVDQIWRHLQPHCDWFGFTPKLGKQRPGVSDITGEYVNYT